MTNLIEAMRAEFRASLPGIIEGHDPHSDVLDTFDGYRDMLLVGTPPPAVPAPSVQAIQAVVASIAGVPLQSMTQACQRQFFVRPRWVAMFIAHDRYGYSLCHIGRRFRRDHTSVLHAMRRMARMRIDDNEIRDLIDRSVNALGARA
jgi:hypothetical protein